MDGGEVRRRPQPPSGRQALQDVSGGGGQPLARGMGARPRLRSGGDAERLRAWADSPPGLRLPLHRASL